MHQTETETHQVLHFITVGDCEASVATNQQKEILIGLTVCVQNPQVHSKLIL